MYDAAERREVPIEFDMSGEIGRGAEFAFDDLAITVNDDHVFGLHGFVRYAAGLDDDRPGFRILAADVAPRKIDESEFGEFEIGR